MRKQAFAFVLFVPGLATLQAQPKVTVTPTDASLPGIMVIAAAAPEFTAAFSSLVPEAGRAPFDNLLPYSIIVRNGGAQNIVGLCVVFDITASKGRAIRMTQDPVQLPPFGKPALAAGRQLFVSAEPGRTHAAADPRIPIYASQTEEYYAKAQAISISVNSVLFADGTFTGPDRLNLFADYNARLKGDRDFDQTVLSYKGKEEGLPMQYFFRFRLRNVLSSIGPRPRTLTLPD